MILPRYLLNLVFQFLLPTRGFSFKRRLVELAGVAVGPGVRVTSEIKIFGNGSIFLGDDTWVGVGAEFHVPIPAAVTMGVNCDIAPSVKFICGSHSVGGAVRRAGEGTVENIYIGSGVWVGAGAILLPGCHIGDGTVVAAGAVVRGGKYPANILLAGNPAEIKKQYDD